MRGIFLRFRALVSSSALAFSTALAPPRTIQTNPQSTVHELLLRHSIIPIKFRALSRNRFALTFLNLYFAQLPPLAKFTNNRRKVPRFFHIEQKLQISFSLMSRDSPEKKTPWLPSSATLAFSKENGCPCEKQKQKPYRFKAFAGQMTFLDKF